MSLSPNERIQGSWEVIGATGAMSDLNKGTRYIFQGQDLTTSNGIEIKGQFKVNDSTIIWVLPNMEMNYTYRFEGEQLIIEPLNSGQILTLEKQ
ncbi:MAG: hypothetical protein JXR60_02130 [Bacteroidales bacterium]|nr:hypothetical protein [Bacteroidales bacterium]